jgi:hypothetical protein
MHILCKIFNHDWVPLRHISWLLDGSNFGCLRCGKRVKSFEDTLRKNRFKERS